MTPLGVVWWIAWREIRFLVYASLTVFVLLPFALDFLYTPRDAPEVWLYAGRLVNLLGGGTLAVIIGVALACPDLQTHLHTFWRSRPIPLLPLLWAKFSVGLLIASIVPTTSLLVDSIAFSTLYPESLRWSSAEYSYTLIFHTPVLMLIYSVAFFIGCLVRKPVEAALISAAGGVIIYFLPLVYPPLEWLSVLRVDRILSISDPLSFAAVMAIGSGFAFTLAYLTLRRDLMFYLDQKAIGWGLALVAILLFATGSYQLGSNLNCVQVIDRPIQTVSIAATGDAVLISYRKVLYAGAYKGEIERLRTDSTGFLKPASSPTIVHLGMVSNSSAYQSHVVLSQEDPNLAYTVVDPNEDGALRGALFLCTIRIGDSTSMEVVNSLDLIPVFSQDTKPATYQPSLYCNSGRIFIRLNQEVAVVSLADPSSPKAEYTLPLNAFPFRLEDWLQPRDLLIQLPDLPGSSPKERVMAWLGVRMSSENMAIDGDLLVTIGPMVGVRIYRLAGVEEKRARFEYLGEIRHTLSEVLLDYLADYILLHNGFCYACGGSGLTVYDIRDPRNPRRAGHYKAPGEWFHAIAPLPNGRVLLGGNNLHVIAPPR